MRVELVSQDSLLVCVKLLGKVTQNAFGAQDEPLRSQFGPDVYRQGVLVDLSGSEFLDSRGVGWMLKCHKRFREAGGIFVLHSIPPVIREVLDVLRMDLVFDLADDEQAARAKASAASHS